MNADADLSPQGVAGLVRDFIATLGLGNVTIVGNDTGGAICQLMLAGDTSRIGAAVLTNCDAFDAFPPRALAPLFFAGRHPALVACLVPGLRSRRVRTGKLGFGPLTSAPLDAELTRGWIEPLASKAIRRDLATFARGVRPRVLLDAATRFGQFTGPVRILWGDDDAYFGPELGRRLSEAFPHASLATVPGGRTFLPLEHPDAVAGEIIAAVRRHGAARGLGSRVQPGRAAHQGSGRPSRKKPPVGPLSGRVAAHTRPAAPAETGRPPAPPMSVATQPGQTAFTRKRSARSSAASIRVRAFSAALEAV